MRASFSIAGASALAIAVLGVSSVGAAGSTRPVSPSTPANINASQRLGNQSEESVAINPTNPNNVVIVTNIDGTAPGMFEAVSLDGGKTWLKRLIATGAPGDPLGPSCCDPSLSFDHYGNLFMTYLYLIGNTVPNLVPVALSTDGGLTFKVIANIASSQKRNAATSSERRGLFRFVDQPTITTGANEVWLVFNGGGPIIATGASVTGFGQVSNFITAEVVPGTNNCTYGDVAIGPQGQVMNVCTLTETGAGGGTLRVNVDADGLGPAGFGQSVSVTDAHIGGFHFIPAQVDRSIDAEPGLAWDRTGGRHNGRVYLVYTFEPSNGTNDTDVFVQSSDDQGATWSSPVRINDDTTTNSQFLPKISLDQTTGNLAAVWYDARNDLGAGGPGDTDGVPNDDAQFWGAFSLDGGQTFTKNIQISAGTSNSHDSGNNIDYGDYSGLSFDAGIAHPAWADNSNSTGDNPDGTLHQLDIYTATVPSS